MFRFRLQNVLDIREQHERTIATQLVHALSEQESAQEQLRLLQGTREAGAQGEAGVSRPVGELANIAFMLHHLDGRIAEANDAVQAASVVVSQAQDALTVAHQGRRVLDRLRDRHEETYRTAAEQSDRRTMDDIALSRFTQNDTP